MKLANYRNLRGIVIGLGLAASAFGMSQDLDVKVERDPRAELVIYSFDVPKTGQIKVYAPELWAGATFSGTVVAIPEGKSDAEKRKNEGILQGYVIQTPDQKAKPGDTLKFLTPALGTGILFSLLGPDGKPAGQFTAPLQPTPPPALPNFSLPEIVQPGQPFSIPGPCDGDLSNLNVKIGGQAMPMVAESPRGAIGICPPGVNPGQQPIEIEEGTANANGATRAVSVTLQAQRTLTIGQSTPMSIQVRGMEGFDKPSHIRIVNRTPGIVELMLGNLKPGNEGGVDLAPFGANETLRTLGALSLVALSVGSFEVECQLMGGRCGATTHELFIVGPSKSGNAQKGFSVEWTEVCYKGTCYLKPGHAGDHAYSWSRCKDHADIPHKETFDNKEDRDARYREIEKEAKKRNAEHDFKG
jgi:hypothetical protein